MEFPNQREGETADLASRKADHISYAFSSQKMGITPDQRFYYEPLLGAHPLEQSLKSPEKMAFLGKSCAYPLWISSMTGGTEKASFINRNLATVARRFNLGMGLGSCRELLENENSSRLKDFLLRPILGDDNLFYANLGIAQVEKAYFDGDFSPIIKLVERTETDGLNIHVNPLQEWLQPEGDMIHVAPIKIIKEFLQHTKIKTIVKEVGQGMGPKSLLELMRLPLQGIEFGAFGGTNFSSLELLRGVVPNENIYDCLTNLGHTPLEMIEFINAIIHNYGPEIRCHEFIISGGVQNFLDVHYYRQKLLARSVCAMASNFLRYALEGEMALSKFVEEQIKGLRLAQNYLKLRDDFGGELL